MKKRDLVALLKSASSFSGDDEKAPAYLAASALLKALKPVEIPSALKALRGIDTADLAASGLLSAADVSSALRELRALLVKAKAEKTTLSHLAQFSDCLKGLEDLDIDAVTQQATIEAKKLRKRGNESTGKNIMDQSPNAAKVAADIRDLTTSRPKIEQLFAALRSRAFSKDAAIDIAYRVTRRRVTSKKAAIDAIEDWRWTQLRMQSEAASILNG